MTAAVLQLIRCDIQIPTRTKSNQTKLHERPIAIQKITQKDHTVANHEQQQKANKKAGQKGGTKTPPKLHRPRSTIYKIREFPTNI